jgi:hypothetical protein
MLERVRGGLKDVPFAPPPTEENYGAKGGKAEA